MLDLGPSVANAFRPLLILLVVVLGIGLFIWAVIKPLIYRYSLETNGDDRTARSTAASLSTIIWALLTAGIGMVWVRFL